MATSIVDLLPKDYGFVVLALVLYFFLNFWMAFKVLQARTSIYLFTITISSALACLALGGTQIRDLVIANPIIHCLRYNVRYPALYASEAENKDAKLFNCVQRGHQNSLETMPVFFVELILGGLMYPRIAASLGLLYSVTRYFYFKGYATGVPSNHTTIGRYGVIPLLGLMICTASLGIHLLLLGA